MSFVRNAASVLLVSSVEIPAGFLTSVVLARWLSVDDRGVYGLVMALAAMMCLGLQLGLPSAAIYRIRRVGADAGSVLAAGLVMNLFVLGMAVAVAFAMRGAISDRFLAGAGNGVLYLALALAGAQLLGMFIRAVARGLDRFDLHNVYGLVEGVGTLVAVSIALIVLGGSLPQALGATLSVQLAALVLVGGVVAARSHLHRTLRLDDLGASLRFGLKNYAQNLSRHAHERFGVLLIAFFLEDPGQAAFFVVALGLVRIVSVAPTAVSTALFPQLAGLDERDGARLTARVTRHAVLWAVGVTMAFLVAGPILIPWVYGASYQASVLPFLLLLPGAAAVTVSQVVSRYFIAYNVQGAVITARVVSALANLGLNVWLIPKHGILGAATASLLSNGFEACLVVGAFVRLSGRGLGETLRFRREDWAAYLDRLPRLRGRGPGAS